MEKDFDSVFKFCKIAFEGTGKKVLDDIQLLLMNGIKGEKSYFFNFFFIMLGCIIGNNFLSSLVVFETEKLENKGKFYSLKFEFSTRYPKLPPTIKFIPFLDDNSAVDLNHPKIAEIGPDKIIKLTEPWNEDQDLSCLLAEIQSSFDEKSPFVCVIFIFIFFFTEGIRWNN
jgi:hypothetical protein